MIDTKIKGNVTEMESMLAFMKLGYNVSIPFGEDSRYDFVVDINDKLYKIQCKTCSEIVDENNQILAIKFKTVRQSGSKATNWTRTKYEENEIDYFATSYQGKCYLVPLKECSNEKILRIVPPKNGQIKGISFLEKYELNEVLKTL
jgi:hypothetical protein